MYMPYLFYPHIHTKIWLSKYPQQFMNLENADRLIKMREININDKINFVYDSSLLNEEAHHNLKKFCQLYRLTPIDVPIDILPLLQSDLETELFEFYKNEITNASRNGNLGMASDILRWLILGLNLGLSSYTDFDVTVNSSNLPEQIEADAPLLFNIGSISDGHSSYTGIRSNTDVILVSNSDEAKKQIEIFQKILLSSLKHQFFYEETMSPLLDFLKPHFIRLNPVESKKYLMDLTENNQSFVIGLGGEIDKIDELLLSIESRFPTIYPKNLRSIKNHTIDSVTEMRKLARYELILTYVCHVSGPDVLRLWFQYIPLSTNILRTFEIMQRDDLLPSDQSFSLPYPPEGFRFDFEIYSLYSKKEISQSFISLNGIPLGCLLDSPELKNTEGACSDLSWLEEGENEQRKREVMLAIKWQQTPLLSSIYGFFHKSEPHVKPHGLIDSPIRP